MVTRQQVQQAVDRLKANGRNVEAAEVALEGGQVIPVDGIPRSPQELVEMAARLQDKE